MDTFIETEANLETIRLLHVLIDASRAIREHLLTLPRVPSVVTAIESLPHSEAVMRDALRIALLRAGELALEIAEQRQRTAHSSDTSDGSAGRCRLG